MLSQPSRRGPARNWLASRVHLIGCVHDAVTGGEAVASKDKTDIKERRFQQGACIPQRLSTGASSAERW